jgi:hypothetical protein
LVSSVDEVGGIRLFTSTVESHASGTSEIVLLDATLLDGLLGHGITGSKEDLVDAEES